MGGDSIGEDHSVAQRRLPMQPRPLPLSLVAVLLCPEQLQATTAEHRQALLRSGHALPVWLDPAAGAAASWALIALRHGVPEALAAYGYSVLRETVRCPLSTEMQIALDSALSMMAEALRCPDRARADWARRHSAWRAQHLERAA